jgi:PAS domain S-box-containing protein
MAEFSSPSPHHSLPGEKGIDPGDRSTCCRCGDVRQDEIDVLRDTSDLLERRVLERTKELQEANDRLRHEIAECKRLEEVVRGSRREFEPQAQEPSAEFCTTNESVLGKEADRRPTAEALRESEGKYRVLLENMPAGFALHEMIYDGDGRPLDYRFLEINPAFERLTGLPIRTTLGRTVREVLPGIEQYWIDVYGKVAQTGEAVAYQNFASELNRFFDIWVFSPAKDQFAVIFSDVTVYKQIEHSLRASETRFRTLIENSRVGVGQATADGRFAYVNPALLSMLEAESSEEIVGRKVSSIGSPDSRNVIDQEVHKRSQGVSSSYEVSIVGLRGGIHDVVISGAPLYLEGGEFAGSIGSFMEITKRKRAEEKLEHMQAQLAHVARLSTVGELAAEVAHELSQPLYAILNYAKASRNRLAANESPDLEEVRESNEKIERIAKGASGICKRLRSFSRRAETERLPCDVNEIVMESLALVAFEARQKKVVLETKLSQNSLIVSANRVEIQQVLVNLLHNAFEAMAGLDESAQRVIIQTTEVDRSVEIVVSDNGVGLPGNDHRNIFEPFVTTKPDGLGMGLAISSTIVQRHGGRLWCRSNPEGGATFHCALPRA